VYIGERVTIGQYTTVLPGAVIGNGTIVGAGSLVPKNAVLEGGGVYGGVPARLLVGRQRPVQRVQDVRQEVPPQRRAPPSPLTVENKVNAGAVLVAAYGWRHSEIQNLEGGIVKCSNAALGLSATVVLYGVINNRPELLYLLPAIVGISYVMVLNLSTAMIRLAARLYSLETELRRTGMEYASWELSSGVLARTRMFDTDSIVLAVMLMLLLGIGTVITVRQLASDAISTFAGVRLEVVFVLIDAAVLLLVVWSAVYFAVRRRRAMRALGASG